MVVQRACSNGGRSLDRKLLRRGFLVLALSFAFALSLIPTSIRLPVGGLGRTAAPVLAVLIIKAQRALML